jgi:hypothetical protein
MMFKFAEEDRALVEESLWFPCSLDSGAFTTDHDTDDWIETDENPPGEKLQDALEGMVERAASVLGTEQKAKLRNLVFEFIDIWRVAASGDGPAKVTPFKVQLKHDAVRQGARCRRYTVDHRNWTNWMLKHVKALEETGFV